MSWRIDLLGVLGLGDQIVDVRPDESRYAVEVRPFVPGLLLFASAALRLESWRPGRRNSPEPCSNSRDLILDLELSEPSVDPFGPRRRAACTPARSRRVPQSLDLLAQLGGALQEQLGQAGVTHGSLACRPCEIRQPSIFSIRHTLLPPCRFLSLFLRLPP